MADVALTLEDVEYAYGSVHALRGLSLEVRRGEVLAILGPNGAGKTTLLELVCGLLEPDRGRLDRPFATREIGYAPQELLVWPQLTPREQLVFLGRVYRRARAEATARAKLLLDRLGLADKADELTGTLSGGMQRRVSLGLALVHEPPLLVLDQPTEGLDPESRRRVHALLASLEDTTMLWCTHDVAEAERTSDRVAIVERGAVVQVDTAAALLRTSSSRDATLEDVFFELTGRRLT